MATKAKTDEKPVDAQLQTRDAGPLFEVLAEAPNGHRTVYRVYADSLTAAQKQVADTLDDGVKVLGASAAGCGLGSGDSSTT
ncbi:MAG TPA: hypothetical protein VI011_17845 [Asanoa sp.]